MEIVSGCSHGAHQDLSEFLAEHVRFRNNGPNVVERCLKQAATLIESPRNQKPRTQPSNGAFRSSAMISRLPTRRESDMNPMPKLPRRSFLSHNHDKFGPFVLLCVTGRLLIIPAIRYADAFMGLGSSGDKVVVIRYSGPFLSSHDRPFEPVLPGRNIVITVGDS
jgi:hypothetical protein